MFTHTSQTRRTMTLLSAGAAAALLITGLGVFQARANNLTWNPNQSATGGTNGSGTWNSSGTYWYDSTTSSGPVAWTNGDGAYLGAGTGGSGNYTVTLGSSSGTYSTTNLGVNNSGNAYVLNGGGGTITNIGTGSSTEQLVVNGSLSLENITLKSYSTIAVNSGSAKTGSLLNINSGTTVTMASSSNLYLSDATGGAGGSTGTVDVNGGSLTVQAITVEANTIQQTGILNINSGTVTTTAIAGVTSKSTTNVGSTTTVNLNGGTLDTRWITSTNKGNEIVNFNGGVLQANNIGGIGAASSSPYTIPSGSLNVQTGGAIMDSNAHTYWIQEPLVHDATLGSTTDGGLTVMDSKATGSQTTSYVTLQGANTYTGPTTVQAGGDLVLAGAATAANGVALAAATIADSSAVTINSGGVLTLANDSAATQVNALNINGGSLTFELNSTQTPSLTINSKANVSGVNNINIFAVSGTTSFTMGTYNLITDSLGGLSGGTFQFTGGGQTAIAGPLSGGNSYLLTLGSSDTAETLTISAVPEPATLGLFAVSGIALLLVNRKRRSQA